MKRFICTLDNGTDTVPPLDEWRECSADSHRNACLEYTKGISGTGAFKVLVGSKAHYDEHGWAGMPIHAFSVTFG